MQLVHNSNRCDALLDLLLTKKEDSTTDMKVEGSLGSSNHEIREFKILQDVRKITSRTTDLEFRRVDFSLLWEFHLVWQVPSGNSIAEQRGSGAVVLSKITSSQDKNDPFQCAES